jgi:putative flavoprotein involved in K+ transport
MNDTRRVPTIVIGAGQAGLAMSRLLTLAGRDHLVLERRATLGGGWQDRWDSFRLVTPNWTASLPGLPYDGPDPDGFMPRDEIAGRVARYAARLRAPVMTGTPVERLAPITGGGFRLETGAGPIQSDQVVVATGSYHVPRVPDLAAGLSTDIQQVHSHGYHDDRSLPPGAVLVVGSGQTGIQLADELLATGRRVYLALGSNGWAPRRYRGRDIFRWLATLEVMGETYGVHVPRADTLPDPRLRLAGTPQLSGHHGGRDVDLRRMARRDGLTLLGHLESIDGHRLMVAPDLGARLRRSEAFFDEVVRPPIDSYIARAGIEAPPGVVEHDPYVPPERTEMDLRAEGIASVLWATGYRMDHSWIDAPITDAQGIPRQHRGVSEIPGLYFIGLLWQHSQASATLFGPTVDTPYLAARMGLSIPQGDETGPRAQIEAEAFHLRAAHDMARSANQ